LGFPGRPLERSGQAEKAPTAWRKYLIFMTHCDRKLNGEPIRSKPGLRPFSLFHPGDSAATALRN